LVLDCLTHSSIFIIQAYKIDTFATRVGVKRIAQGATACLFANYVQAVLTGAFAPPGTFNKISMIGGHMALAAALIVRYRQLDPESMGSVKKYYKHIWDLFYLEYGLYTLI
jgi:homogentisate solanesyltransferase